MTLEEAKSHPWVIEDLNEVEKESWILPVNHPKIEATKSEMFKAVTAKVIMN